MNKIQRTPTLRDAVYGLAVGDALGVPVEFLERGTFHVTGMKGYGTYNVPAGTWSDDTSMTLATCDSIREKGCIDADDMGHKFKQWIEKGAYTPFGVAFDVGNTTRRAVLAGKGEDDEWSNGNGSLMRIIPLAFTDASDEDVEAVSAITHAHQMSRHVCVSFVRIARDIIEGRSLEDAVVREAERGEFKELASLKSMEEKNISSSGYVLHTFYASIWCLLTSSSYEEAVRKAVNLGDDSDTTGAVCGALAGMIYGMEAIPAAWIDTLKAKQKIEACLF